MKPYVWRGKTGWFLSMGKHPIAILKGAWFPTWPDAMDAALAHVAMPS